ncbi:MAG: glycosyltransferase family 4 protein [Thermoproteales archaeon]|nr:glycosyltransferase family 4 protein [Thermoproteales archaeon]
MTGSPKNKLLVVMSYGTGLSTWESVGMLARNLKTIAFFSRFYEEVILYSYEHCDNLKKYKAMLPPNVTVLCNPNYTSKIKYNIISILRYRKKLRNIPVTRSWQLWGSWIALWHKILYRSRFILRQGFQFSVFAKNKLPLLYILATIYEFIAYNAANVVIVTTKRDRDYIIKKYGIKPDKVIVIPNWVDTELFKPIKNVKKERGKVIFVGRLEKQKNVLSLIEAVKNLDDVKLYIYGKGSLEKQIKEKIWKEKITNVYLRGIIKNELLPYELNTAEIFILPSLYEGHPKALLEAMACGLPVIGSNVEGIRDLIKEGETGLLCSTTPESIREKIIYLLNNPEIRKKLGENARKYVVEHFSFKAIIEKELEIHKKLLGLKQL